MFTYKKMIHEGRHRRCIEPVFLRGLMGEKMFYEEKFANGILYYRSDPDGEWYGVPYEEVVKRLMVAEDKLRRIYQECLK